MSLSKLQKFINSPRPTVTGQRQKVPVLLSDSKGVHLQEQATHHPVERQIEWWCKKGSTIKNSITWLKKNIERKIYFLGNISLYVWLGTCNLTTKDKNYNISISCWNDDVINEIIEGYHEILTIIREYPNCKVTILELPIYSISHYNKADPNEQDEELARQIYKLNGHIRKINKDLHSISPEFSSDLRKNSKYKAGAHRDLKNRSYYNFKLYKDGLHSGQTLSKAWLRKIAKQMYQDCWM